jgi:chloramphenicol-sensitive protein RarD
MDRQTSGVLAMVAACMIWGLSPLYYKLLVHVPPLELLAHRTLWSLVTFAGLLAVQRRLGALGGALGSGRALAVTACAALMISANWFLFIFSVQIGRVTESALGYYIFPLVAVMLGVAIYGERLGRLQWAAVALAALGVAVLTSGQGAAPWISLVLALTFGLYGMLKKRLSVGPVVSVTAEVTLLAPVAALWLVWLHGSGAGGVFGQDARTSALLMLSGLLTALPLILFSRAAQRVRLATVGLIQYINPTLQFLCAVLIFGEGFTPVHAVTFGLIWTALAVYSAASWRSESARRRAAMPASAVSATNTKSSSEGSAKP